MSSIPTYASVVLSALALFSAYLVVGCFGNARSSPPIFFTFSLVLALLAYHPTIFVAGAAVILVFIANLLLALDQIHGECWYGVLTGGSSWHQARLGQLLWYKQCQQPALAFWIMLVLGLLWLAVFAFEAHKAYYKRDGGVRLADN